MKKHLLCTLSCLALTLSAFAGGVETKLVKAPETQPCYRGGEWILDVFGSYYLAETRLRDGQPGTNANHGWGGGIDVNYFICRYFGVGIENSYYDARGTGHCNKFLNANLYLRYPIEGKCCWAPYLIVGGGYEWSEPRDNIHFAPGIGVDVRIAPHISVFADARYTWTGGPRVNNDFGLFRTGVGFVF